MTSLFGGLNPTSSSGSNAAVNADVEREKQQIIQKIRGEAALMNAQNLLNTMNEKCFLKCVTKPSTSLSGSEETCLTRCMQRYMEAFNIVSRAYTSRLSRENLERASKPDSFSSS